jgi:hypothetical protein
MITGRRRFNLYLLAALLAMAACGCQTEKDKKDKELATFRFYLQAGPEDTDRSMEVPVYRAQPVQIRVRKEPDLTEAQVASARVVDVLGGFDLLIQLDRQGTWLLQQYSATYSGKHYVVFSQFGEKAKETRWLAAPQFKHLLSDGILQFTPDATREEAEEIAKGLNNLAKKNESTDKW